MAKDFILNNYGKDYYPTSPNSYVKGKQNVQDAHEAIRPSYPDKTPESIKQYLAPDQYKLYKLIWDKFMSSQMAPATVANKSVEILAGDYTLKAGTSKILFDGFLKLYNDAEEDEKEADAKIPDLENGDKITFHHETNAGGVDLFTFSGYPDIVGFCCEPGTSTDESGTATVKVISNNTLLAKTLYYIHAKGWDTNARLYSSGPGPLPSGWQYRTVVQTMTQYATVGNEAVNYWKTHYDRTDWSDENIQMVVDEVNNKASKVTVPDNFRAFIATQSGQDSAVLYQPATGKLKISKTVQEGSTEPTFTFNIYISGVNGTYSGVTFSNGNASITLKHGQSKTIENLPSGKSYSVTEQSIIGWELVSSSGTTGTIPSGSTATASFTNKIKYIDITINKGTTNANVTNGNSLYNVAGTTFALYRTQADARNGSSPVATFTISSNGSSETRSIQEGYYYLAETKAATGYLIPDSLKNSSGGVYIDATYTRTINI
jgi:hypothetical protein